MRSSVLSSVFALTTATATFAADGAIEINQAKALAGFVTTGDIPGFPVDLTTPGRYVLTSNLDVPRAVDGLVIHVPGVTIDLNGLRISSTFNCGEGCGLGDGVGVVSVDGKVKVMNGEVSGFAFGGVDLGPFSHVEGLLVSAIGGDAIALGGSSLALGNRVTSIGKSGLAFKGPLPGIYRDNVLVNTGKDGSGATAVEGISHATGGNFCEDGSCSTRGARRYYRAVGGQGNVPLARCDPGFHFATLFELLQTTGIEFDPVRSGVFGTSDGFPQTGLEGWVRTGGFSLVGRTPGRATCARWTSNSENDSGTTAQLLDDWSLSPENPGRWVTSVDTCNRSKNVWCIEN